MRVLCDTNVLARAATRPGGPAQEVLRRLIASPGHVLIATPFLLGELTRVLGYARIKLRAAATDEEIAAFLDELEGVAEIATPPDAAPAVVGDPADDAVLAGCIAGRVEVLCTRDRHFHRPTVLALCAAQGIRILDELSLLAELRASKSSSEASD
jgi:predicted nucleic acid-binding protein